MTPATATTCPSGKVRHASRRAARVSLSRVQAKRAKQRRQAGEADVYWCLTCRGWHLTHQVRG